MKSTGEDSIYVGVTTSELTGAPLLEACRLFFFFLVAYLCTLQLGLVGGGSERKVDASSVKRVRDRVRLTGRVTRR